MQPDHTESDPQTAQVQVSHLRPADKAASPGSMETITRLFAGRQSPDFVCTSHIPHETQVMAPELYQIFNHKYFFLYQLLINHLQFTFTERNWNNQDLNSLRDYQGLSSSHNLHLGAGDQLLLLLLLLLILLPPPWACSPGKTAACCDLMKEGGSSDHYWKKTLFSEKLCDVDTLGN